jgi:hypothetical protein
MVCEATTLKTECMKDIQDNPVEKLSLIGYVGGALPLRVLNRYVVRAHHEQARSLKIKNCSGLKRISVYLHSGAF